MQNLPTRNNNPGDLKDPKTGSFRQFADPQSGFSALESDLQGKITGNTKTGLTPQSTIADFAKVWAPASDKNNPDNYARVLASHLQVDPATPIGQLNNRVHDFANAIASAEGYQGSSNTQTQQPQQKYSMEDFGKKIQSKYWQYANLDPKQVAQKVLQKYPQYQNSIDTSAQTSSDQPNNLQADTESAQQYGASFPARTGDNPLQAGLKAAGNVPSSFLNLGENLGNIVLHPIKTAEGIGNAAVGAGKEGLNTFAGQNFNDDQTNTFDSLKSALGKRYGSLENLQRTATNDPAGFGLDVLTLLQGGGALADLATGAKTAEGAKALSTIESAGRAGTTDAADVARSALLNKQNIEAATQIRNGTLLDAGDKVLSQDELSGLTVPYATAPLSATEQAVSDIKNIQKTILDDLPKEVPNIGQDTLSKIANLDPSSYSSVEDFVKDASKFAGKGKGFFSNILNNTISNVGGAVASPFKKLGNGLYNSAAETVGLGTGTGGDVVKESINAVKQGGGANKAFLEGLRGNIGQDQLVDEAKDALNSIVSKRRLDYQSQLGKIAGETKTYDISPIVRETDEQLSKFNIGKGTPGALDFSRSKFALDTSAQRDIQQLYDYVKGYGGKAGDRTAVGLDNLKKVVGGYYSPNSDYRAFVKGVQSSIWNPADKSGVLGQVPGYAELSGKYEEASNLIEDIQKGLSLGDKAAVETSFKKLTSALRQNNEFRKDLINDLDEASGGKLLPKIAGQQMSSILPRGLIRQGEGLLGIHAAITGTGLLPLIGIGIATSPRIVGEIINALGFTGRQAAVASQVLSKFIPSSNAGLIGGNAVSKLTPQQNGI